VPLLEKQKSKGRSHFGDLLAVLLLLAFLAGMGWLWWQEKHPKKATKARTHIVVQTTEPVKPPQPALPPKPAEKLAIATTPAAPPATSTSAPIPDQPAKLPVVAPPATTELTRPVRDVFEAQVALVRLAISPGSLDSAIGSQTRSAIRTFQHSESLPESGILDTNTRAVLTLDAPLLTTYTVTTNDLARLQPIGKTWVEKSEQTALDYETILELVAEKAHSNPLLIQKLNPGTDWANVAAGTELKVPDAK
jgi:peptidoglycan hydrolase-like protein with peptidoglycan-binding domain